MTARINATDTKHWKPRADATREEINTIRTRLRAQLGDNNYTPFITPPTGNPSPNTRFFWQSRYLNNQAELNLWRQAEANPWDVLSTDQLIARISQAERQAMKTTAHSWLQEIVDSTNAEAGRPDEYDSHVNRFKGNNYHQRGHYFIFYGDDTPQNPRREHWLALYPSDAAAGSGGFNEALKEGHSHQAFVLNFDKPVSKFVDVYTCIGCGAADAQYFTSLHGNYNDASADSWDNIYKGLPFEPWDREFYIHDQATPLISRMQNDGRIMSASGQYCLGNRGHTSEHDLHVWEGKTIEDRERRTFDKAYGYIPRIPQQPNQQSGTIQWKLARDIRNEAEWVNKRIPYHADKLWGKNEFADLANRSTIKQRATDMTIDELLQERQYVIEYLRANHNVNNINDQLRTELKRRFWNLITAKRNSYLALEALIKRHLNGIDIATIIREASVTVPTSATPIQIPTSTEALTIRTIWNQQVERFIREGKDREFYAERTGSNGPYPSIDYNSFEANINSLYQRLFDNLGFSNQIVADIRRQVAQQVAQIVVNPRS